MKGGYDGGRGERREGKMTMKVWMRGRGKGWSVEGAIPRYRGDRLCARRNQEDLLPKRCHRINDPIALQRHSHLRGDTAPPLANAPVTDLEIAPYYQDCLRNSDAVEWGSVGSNCIIWKVAPQSK